MPTVRDLADHLAPALDRERYHREGDPAGVWIDSPRDVRRLALRLEPGRPPYPWAESVDAVLIHRPFGLWPARLPEGVGVIAAHRALDDKHSIGVNPALADALGLEADGEILRRDGRAKGAIARFRTPLSADDATDRVAREFGGVEEIWGEAPETVHSIALAGAMTDAMVRDAAAHGAGLYLTGQLRKPGRRAVEDSQILAVGVGQDRAEAWGLRRLGAVVRERWPEVEIVESGLPVLVR